MSQTELWSYDPKGKSRSINVILAASATRTNKLELRMQWSDGEQVQFPVLLTSGDLRSLLNLIVEEAKETGIELS